MRTPAELEFQQESQQREINEFQLPNRISYLNKSKHHAVSKIAEYIIQLKKHIINSQKKINEFEQIHNLLESDTVMTFADGQYTNNIKACIRTLMTVCTISVNKMTPVIRAVLNMLANTNPERFPSEALLSRVMVEAKILTSKQVAQA
jgi:hypothetical protein